MSIVDCSFINNIAIQQGGAIYYNFRRPHILNTFYSNNTALYGPNIASYPVRIVFNNSANDSMRLTDVVSGAAYSNKLNLTIIDYDNQVMNLLSNSQIKIVAVINNATVKGIDSSKLIDGVAEFDNIQFIYKPGHPNTTYLAISNLIDANKVRYVDVSTDNTISVSFRYCKPGEVIVNNRTCRQCDAGTYSLKWNSTECHE